MDPLTTPGSILGEGVIAELTGDFEIWGTESADEFAVLPPKPGRLRNANVPAIATLLKILLVRHRFSFRRNLWRAWHRASPPIPLLSKHLQCVVEAAGIEPASREPSLGASTHVVSHLVLVGPAPTDRIRTDQPDWAVLPPSPLPYGPKDVAAKPASLSPGVRPQAGRTSAWRSVKPPLRMPVWHVWFLPGVLRGLLTTSVRNSRFQCPVETLSPPTDSVI